jgi:glycosyltransferase involved in cell wall biosynthesis
MRPEGGAVALTVILPVYNGADSVGAQLDALVAQHWSEPWEVLVVDNASTDETPAIVASYASAHPDRVRVVAAPDAHNLAYVRNVGVRQARGTAVAFCDDDDLVGERWVPAMGDALRDHRLVGSRMEYARLSAEAALTDRADFQSEGIEEVFGIPVVNGVSGVQRALWDELGGNDETLAATGEDLDFAIRAHLHRGVEPHFAPDAVYHVQRRDHPASTFRQARRYGRAMALLYARYGRRRRGRRSTAKEVVWAWTWIGLHVGDLRAGDRAVRWAWRAGMRLGRLEGSVRHRVVYL